jgi:peptidoglycan/LPS O-acetylase OafA/YrhL
LELDVLRGMAILLVLGIHSPSERGESGLLRPVDIFIHQFGWTGVDLFFVLSGFLIGSLMFDEIRRTGTLDVRRFLVRRMFRIWPAYYCLLVFVLFRLTVESGGDFRGAWSRIWPAFIHIQNFIEGPRDQLWSLAIEEHFYLALPVFLWLVMRNRSRNDRPSVIPRACIILSVASVALRTVLALTTNINVRMQTYLSMDALFFGVNLAYLKAYRPEFLPALARRRWLLLGLSVLLFAPAVVSPFTLRRTIGYTGVYLGYALVLIAFTHTLPGNDWLDRWKNSRSARWVAAVGTHSYSIYIWHRDTSWWAYEKTLALGRALHLPTELTWTLHTLAYIAASIVGGAILGRLIETPALRLRERLFPSRVPSVAANVAARPAAA